jgi:UDP-N-acetylglucosamine 2-epimerase (non-hydrolysing)
MGIPVYHMEAGNRCYDDRVPEEVNRRIIDHCSDILMPYTERSRSNLLREGIPSKRIFVTGNPIYEVLLHYDTSIQKSDIVKDLDIEPKHYILVTMHRTENVDVEERLVKLTNGLNLVQQRYGCPVIVSTHPHTQKRLESFGIKISNDKIRFLPPFGFFDYVSLERNALCVLTDSGTAQEECCVFGVPNVTIRDTTERPETVECGSNILSGVEPEALLNAVELVLATPCDWTPPREYLEKDVSTTVAKIVVGLHGSNQLQNSSG